MHIIKQLTFCLSVRSERGAKQPQKHLQSNALFACSLCSHAEQCAICMLTLFACRAMRYLHAHFVHLQSNALKLHAHFVRMQSNALQSSALHCGLRGYRRGKARSLRSRAKKRQAKCLSFFVPWYHYSKIFKSKNAFLFRDLFRDLFLPLF